MARRVSRRGYLRALCGAAALGGLAAPATAADCGATVYANATDDGEPKLEVPSGEAWITGQSTCEPGTHLTVTARNSGGTSPFAMAANTTVGDTGGWSVTFDFDPLDPGTTFELAVVHDDGDRLDALDNCEVVADAPPPAATPDQRPTPTETAASTETHIATRPPTETPRTITETPTPTPTVGHDKPTSSPTIHFDPQCRFDDDVDCTPTAREPQVGGSWSGWARLLVAPVATFLAAGTVGLLAVAGMLARWRLAPDGADAPADAIDGDGAGAADEANGAGGEGGDDEPTSSDRGSG